MRTNALDYFGGFEGYQKALSDSLRNAMLKKPVREVVDITSKLKEGGIFPSEESLLDLAQNPDKVLCLTPTQYDIIKTALGIKGQPVLDKKLSLTPEEKEYWGEKFPAGDQPRFSATAQGAVRFYALSEYTVALRKRGTRVA